MSDPRTALVAAEWCDELVTLPRGSRVPQLGGGSTSESQLHAERFRLCVVGLSEQLRRPRQRDPGAAFHHADFTELELEPGSVDATLDAFDHVPRELPTGLVALREPEGDATSHRVPAGR